MGGVGGWGLGVFGGVGGWGLGCLGGAPTHVHAHACMRGKHDNFMQMAAPNGFGEILGIPYDVIRARVRACACVHMRVHVCKGYPLTTPHPHPPTPPPPKGGTPRISQNSIALELIEIFQFRLKI